MRREPASVRASVNTFKHKLASLRSQCWGFLTTHKMTDSGGKHLLSQADESSGNVSNILSGFCL